MRPITLLRLAFSGSVTDRVRAALTVVAASLAALGILATTTVLNMAPVRPQQWRYTTTLLNDMGLRPGLIAMVAATVIPALVLIAQAARLGGPARDRRLAAMRLAGASPKQCRTIAAAEQGVTVGMGALLGMAAYPLLHMLLHQPTMRGTRQTATFEGSYTGALLPLPTDTWPRGWVWPVVALGLPVIAALLSALTLRQVIAPNARVRLRRRPRLWPSALIVSGLVGMALCRAWIDRLSQPATTPYVVMIVCLLAVCVGVPLCAAGVGYLTAKLVLRFSNRPAVLVAARRVLADPYSGSRAVAVLLVCTVLLSGLVGFGTYFDFLNETSQGYGIRFGDEDLTALVLRLLTGLAAFFIAMGTIGLLITLADNALTRRRTDAALLATGTPPGVLIRSRVIVVLLTAVPGVLLGLVTGYAAPALALPPAQKPATVTLTCHGFGGDDTIVPCTAEGVARQKLADLGQGEAAYSHIDYATEGPTHNVYPPIPLRSLALYGGLALFAAALATVLSLLFGRRSGAVTALRTT